MTSALYGDKVDYTLDDLVVTGNCNIKGTLTATNLLYSNTNLSGTALTVSGQTVLGGTTPIQTGYQPGGPGAHVPAELSVYGSIGANAVGTEHRLQNNWDGNNSVSVTNISTNNSSSAIRFLNNAFAERTAIGYGNPQGDASWLAAPWSDCVYWEASNFVNADGSNTSGAVPNMRIVQTGYINGINANHRRLELSNDGSVNMYNIVNGPISAQRPIFKATAAGSVGIGEGSAWQVGASGPVANLDVYGNAIIGKVNLAAAQRQTNANPTSLAVMCETTSNQLLRLVRNQIIKCDLNINNDTGSSPSSWALGAVPRLDFVDTDHSSSTTVVPLALALDGTGNATVGGNFIVGSNTKPGNATVNGTLAVTGNFSAGGALSLPVQTGYVSVAGANTLKFGLNVNNNTAGTSYTLPNCVAGGMVYFYNATGNTQSITVGKQSDGTTFAALYYGAGYIGVASITHPAQSGLWYVCDSQNWWVH